MTDHELLHNVDVPTAKMLNFKRIVKGTPAYFGVKSQIVNLGDLKGRWIPGVARIFVFTTPRNRRKNRVNYYMRGPGDMGLVNTWGFGKGNDTINNHNSNQIVLYALMLQSFEYRTPEDTIRKLLEFLDVKENSSFVYDFGRNLYSSIVGHLVQNGVSVPREFRSKNPYTHFTPINKNTIRILSILAHLLNTDMQILNHISKDLLSLLRYVDHIGIPELIQKKIL